VPHLNAAPLTRGLDEHTRFLPPVQLAEALRRDELDAALVSVTEVLLQDRYDVLDGVAVASLGEVKSVFLAHRGPIEAIREVQCDATSLTSVMLCASSWPNADCTRRCTRWTLKAAANRRTTSC
jgi:chorismate dehydratase